MLLRLHSIIQQSDRFPRGPHIIQEFDNFYTCQGFTFNPTSGTLPPSFRLRWSWLRWSGFVFFHLLFHWSWWWIILFFIAEVIVHEQLVYFVASQRFVIRILENFRNSSNFNMNDLKWICLRNECSKPKWTNDHSHESNFLKWATWNRIFWYDFLPWTNCGVTFSFIGHISAGNRGIEQKL